MPDDKMNRTNGEDHSKTAAEAMGIAPAVGGRRRRVRDVVESGGHVTDGDLRRQLAAAEEAIEMARAEAKEAREQYVRLAAELDNLRKRHRQEQVERMQYANAELITKLLPVLDNFHRALEHAPDSDRKLVEGLNLLVRQFEEVLESEGVKPIQAVGLRFDPAVHQAVIAEPSDAHDDEVVIEELQKGYTLHDRVLRPSLVKVARNS